MNLENRAAKDAYVQLLCEVLTKKLIVLKELLVLTELQEKIIITDHLDEEQFDQVIVKKEEQIEILTKLDVGFEQIYESIKIELTENLQKYKDEIKGLQMIITDITDVNVKIQALEKRNKAKLDIYFANKRKEIKVSRVSNQTASNYYKTMSKQQKDQSFFYDKKN